MRSSTRTWSSMATTRTKTRMPPLRKTRMPPLRRTRRMATSLPSPRLALSRISKTLEPARPRVVTTTMRSSLRTPLRMSRMKAKRVTRKLTRPTSPPLPSWQVLSTTRRLLRPLRSPRSPRRITAFLIM